MTFKNFKFWLIAIGTLLGVLICIELGYWLGRSIPQLYSNRNESPVAVISGAIFSLLSFILAFIFSILYNRFDARKELVRVEANAIATTWLRSDFIKQPDRDKALKLLEEYVKLRVAAAESLNIIKIETALNESVLIQQQLWNIVVEQTRKDLEPEFASLLVQSLNNMIDTHNLRIVRGYQARTTTGLWVTLYILLVSSMMSIGYQAGVAGTGRYLSYILLAISFTLVFTLIIALYQPSYGYFKVSQQPLINLLDYIKGDTSTLSNRTINPDEVK